MIDQFTYCLNFIAIVDGSLDICAILGSKKRKLKPHLFPEKIYNTFTFQFALPRIPTRKKLFCIIVAH